MCIMTLMGYLPDDNEVIARLKVHFANQSCDLGDTKCSWSSSIYTSLSVFERERVQVADSAAICLGPKQLLGADTHTYFVRNVWNSSWIIWKTSENKYSAFENICKHRGMKLTCEDEGKASKLICPYHNWTYGEDGVCTNIPQQAKAFPDLKLTEVQLNKRTVVEKGSLLWLLPEKDGENKFKREVDPLEKHLAAWDLGNCELKLKNHFQVNANWKLMQESFLEAYHVPFVHSESLAPATINNVWLNDYYGPHSRGLYPLRRIKDDLEFKKAPLNRYLSVVYQIFPNTLISLQPFHIMVMNFWPTGVDKSEVQYSCLARAEDCRDNESLIQRDIEFVSKGLKEDFFTAEKTQEALASGKEQTFMAGKFETQIEHFHKQFSSR
jgi:phenylpropionate dioxygenase-like ring-hydroxylating dioxygenase large terminal subunit